MNAIIAIPYFEGKVFEHFGKSEQFKIYTHCYPIAKDF